VSGSEGPDRLRGTTRERAPVLPILHLDPEVVVVDKPPRVLSAPGRGYHPSVIDLLRKRAEFGGNALRIVHRLDRDASGVQMYARTLHAQRELVRQFSQRRVEKVYFALVTGYVSQDGEIDLPLVFDRRLSRVRAARTRGKPSLTRYRVAQRVAGNTLLECRPVTADTGAIRTPVAHCATGSSLASSA